MLLDRNPAPHNRRNWEKKSVHLCKIHSKTHTLSSLRGRGKGYLYFKQMREGNFKKIIEALVSLPQRMLGNRVHSSLLRRRLGSTQEFPRDGVARVAEGPPWRCGGDPAGRVAPERPGKTGARGRAVRTVARKTGVPTARRDLGGRTVWRGFSRSLPPAAVAEAWENPVPGREGRARHSRSVSWRRHGGSDPQRMRRATQWAGILRLPRPRLQGLSSFAPARGVTDARFSLLSSSASQGSFSRRFPPSLQLSTPFSIPRFLTC